MPKTGLYMMLWQLLPHILSWWHFSHFDIKRERQNPSFIVGIILTIGSVWNYFLLHEPIWFFSAWHLLTYLPFTYLGYLLVKKR